MLEKHIFFTVKIKKNYLQPSKHIPWDRLALIELKHHERQANLEFAKRFPALAGS